LQWISGFLDALQAHVFYIQGNLKGVEEWARQSDLSPDSSIMPHCAVCYLTYVRLLLAQDRYDEAEQFLDQLCREANSRGRNASLISLLILDSRRLEGQGKKSDSRDKMASALRIAAPEGYLRRFLDESDHILEIVRDCQNHPTIQADSIQSSFVSELLLALSPDSPDSTNQLPSRSKSTLIEPLTNQEITVLQLLSSGLSNQEISDELVIGMSTTKWHLHNIYGKLGVKNRTSAIVKAQNLALI
jgi:LuxR family maltose regulon positive regulatory protein